MLLELLATLAPAPNITPPNILIILVDDVGKEVVGCYGGDTDTPNMDAFAESGLRFDRAYSQPRCTTTRAALLTGKHPYRTGVGANVTGGPGGQQGLSEQEVTFPVVLWQHGYRTEAVGKWHLADYGQGKNHPLAFFDDHAGSGWINGSNGQTYWRWRKWSTGQAGDRITSVSRTYAGHDTMADAAVFLAATTEPWLLYLAPNLAHFPNHIPPGVESTLDPNDPANTPAIYRLMVEELDRGIGDILTRVDLETTFVFLISDNGIPNSAAGDGRNVYKNTVFEPGVCVPFMVAGPGVRVGATDELVSVCDVFATVCGLAGTAVPAGTDSVSFMGLLASEDFEGREYVYAEKFAPNGPGPYETRLSMVRDGRYKIIRKNAQADKFFDLLLDPGEWVPLPPAGEDYERLVEEMP